MRLVEEYLEELEFTTNILGNKLENVTLVPSMYERLEAELGAKVMYVQLVLGTGGQVILYKGIYNDIIIEKK